MPNVKLLKSLNIVGLDSLDPVFLAALADRQPLLLIGEHGTAKSEILNRLAASLGLEHRHYNASLLSFDDLLGFPVLNEPRTAMEYIQTPGSLWGAESVFLDELSRCRVENQNKLFSIIHERKVQGQTLEALQYRWAAINPPPSFDDDNEEDLSYTGSIPLDPALADRFPYVIQIPSFVEFSHATIKELLALVDDTPLGSADIGKLVDLTRRASKNIKPDVFHWIRSYLPELTFLLRDGGLKISGRRAVQLSKSIVSIFSASKVLKTDLALEDCALLALVNGIPHRAHGVTVRYGKLKSIHESACKSVTDKPGADVWRNILRELDPAKKIALALKTPPDVIGKADFSTLVLDVWSGLDIPKRYILADILLARLANEDRVTAATYEVLSESTKKLTSFGSTATHKIEFSRRKAGEWSDLLEVISKLKKEKHRNAGHLGNIFYTLFAVEEIDFDPQELIDLNGRWRLAFFTPSKPLQGRNLEGVA